MSRKPVPGYRTFECAACLNTWKEKTRDCQSPSGENCPRCDEFVSPCEFEPHPEWPTDKSGNLLPNP